VQAYEPPSIEMNQHNLNNIQKEINEKK